MSHKLAPTDFAEVRSVQLRLPWVVPAISFLWIVGFLGTAVAVIVALAGGRTFGDGQSLPLLFMAFGLQGAGAIMVLMFFFGSSFGSWTKNFLLRPGESVGAPAALLGDPVPLISAEPVEPDEPTADDDPVEPASADNFRRVHKIISKWEGGYSNHPRDPGGPTNYGITQATLRAWRKRAVTAADVKALSYDEALDIFRARYWRPLRCDEMQVAIALMTYNTGVNSGIGRGAAFLQEVLNKQGARLDEDGEVGPLTLAACRRADVTRLVNDYADRYERFYRSISTFSTFGRGWLNRLADVKKHALAWADEPQPGAQDDPDIPGGPSWLARAVALRGLYEHRGSADNPTILEMARVCGGEIAQSYVHDAIPWCALFVNYCLIASGRAGNDSLWALNFSHYGTRLPGPAVGAIATKRRSGGGGHVFFVLGRDEQGRIVGIGGNQSDMVCDDEFDPGEIVAYTWPDDAPLPARVGSSKTDVSALPVVEAAPKARREVDLPA